MKISDRQLCFCCCEIKLFLKYIFRKLIYHYLRTESTRLTNSESMKEWKSLSFLPDRCPFNETYRPRVDNYKLNDGVYNTHTPFQLTILNTLSNEWSYQIVLSAFIHWVLQNRIDYCDFNHLLKYVLLSKAVA